MALVVTPVERAQAANLVVDNLTDNGALNLCTGAAGDCSLRGALGVANGNGQADHITFLAGLTGAIPIAATLTVSEAGFGTNIDGTGGGSTAPSIMIDGGSGAFDCFTVTSDHNTIRDLSIINCAGGLHTGIVITGAGAHHNLVAGNWIGLDPSGTVVPNTMDGVDVLAGAASNTIGGSTAADRNVISGNSEDGIYILGAATSNNIVRGNYIGTDATGMVSHPNTWVGVRVFGGTGTIVGGTTAGQGNLISHNGMDGIWTTNPATIQGNLIGVASDGITPMANGMAGVRANGAAVGVTIGDTGTTAALPGANVIAHNAGAGIVISGAATQHIRVARNRIFENGGQGIDLATDGVVTRCPVLAAGDGSNNNVHCPLILSVTYTAGTFLVAGSVNVADFLTGSRVDVYEVVADAFGAGEGKTWLAGFNVVNDGITASWGGNVCVNGPTQITGVATDVNGNSSEFALNVNVPLGTCAAATAVPAATNTPVNTAVPAATNTPVNTSTPIHTSTPVATATRTPTTGAMESVTLAGNVCNPVASSYPDSTPIATIAGAVSPSGILISIWWFDPATLRWLGYDPLHPANPPSDLTLVNRLDAIFICVSTAGTWSRPVI
jgi:hypothetical protein